MSHAFKYSLYWRFGLCDSKVSQNSKYHICSMSREDIGGIVYFIIKGLTNLTCVALTLQAQAVDRTFSTNDCACHSVVSYSI